MRDGGLIGRPGKRAGTERILAVGVPGGGSRAGWTERGELWHESWLTCRLWPRVACGPSISLDEERMEGNCHEERASGNSQSKEPVSIPPRI